MCRKLKIKKELVNRITGARKIAVLGIGSELMADDAAGLIVCRKLDNINKGKSNIKTFSGGTAPENLTGEIRKFNPSHLIIIDAVHLGKKEGMFRFIDAEEIGGISFSTHRLPLKIMVDYIKKSLGCKITIIGIQPKKISFGDKPSREVEAAAGEISSALREFVSENN